jgi:hypothetical protein
MIALISGRCAAISTMHGYVLLSLEYEFVTFIVQFAPCLPVAPSLSIGTLLRLSSTGHLLITWLVFSCPSYSTSTSLSVHLGATTPSTTRSYCRTLP